MNRMLNAPVFFLTAVASRPDFKGLSDWDLIRRYPLLTHAALALRVLGLVCCGYLGWRYYRARRHSADFFNAPRPAAGRPGLQLAVMALLAAMLSDALVFATLGGNGDSFSVPTLSGIIIMRLVILIVLLLCLRFARTDWHWLTPVRRPAVPVGALFYLAVLPPVELLVWLTTSLLRAAGITFTSQPITQLVLTSLSDNGVQLVFVLAVVIAPIFEEVIFRGLAYPALKQRWGAVPAAGLVSAAFALTHLHLPSFGPLFVLGIGLCLAYEVSGSLLAPMVMHALFNAVNLSMLLYIRVHS